MLDAIINSMESARETGNLFQGSVTTDSSEYTDSRRNSRFQNFSPQQTSTENLSQQPAQN
ncbi:hypothetical protein HYV50_03835 [Candidatus Pacearchaeota archaeon]|nr:hypothetical protein [Candidatus Pacearchaeota archaeon]